MLSFCQSWRRRFLGVGSAPSPVFDTKFSSSVFVDWGTDPADWCCIPTEPYWLRWDAKRQKVSDKQPGLVLRKKHPCKWSLCLWVILRFHTMQHSMDGQKKGKFWAYDFDSKNPKRFCFCSFLSLEILSYFCLSKGFYEVNRNLF